MASVGSTLFNMFHSIRCLSWAQPKHSLNRAGFFILISAIKFWISELATKPSMFERVKIAVEVLGFWLEWLSLVGTPTPL